MLGKERVMSEIEVTKSKIIKQLHYLCAHCVGGSSRPHMCPVQRIAVQVKAIRGVPLIVNNTFKGALWTHV